MTRPDGSIHPAIESLWYVVWYGGGEYGTWRCMVSPVASRGGNIESNRNVSVVDNQIVKQYSSQFHCAKVSQLTACMLNNCKTEKHISVRIWTQVS